MTHYATLGVSESATQDEIKKAYRSLASKNHPDKGGDTAKFQEIQAAYAALETPEKRAQYDQERQNPGGFRFTVNGSDFDGFPPGMEDIFSRFGFGANSPFGQFRQHQKRNRDLKIELILDLADTLNPQKKTVSVQTSNGDRVAVEVDIPRGVRSGNQIKYSGLGDNMFNTIPRGDLYVHFIVDPHPKFQINGIDLVTTFDINAIDAIIGCSKEFDTLDNRTFSLTVPPGTQPGTKFKIGGQGLYALNQSVRGNLYLIANVTIPTTLTESQLEALRQLTK
jgi:DnaJ-class molecular chaperone